MFSGDECWYLHKDSSHNERVEANKGEKCFVCDTIFASKFDVMEHKKNIIKIQKLAENFKRAYVKRVKKNAGIHISHSQHKHLPQAQYLVSGPTNGQQCSNRIFPRPSLKYLQIKHNS